MQLLAETRHAAAVCFTKTESYCYTPVLVFVPLFSAGKGWRLYRAVVTAFKGSLASRLVVSRQMLLSFNPLTSRVLMWNFGDQ